MPAPMLEAVGISDSWFMVDDEAENLKFDIRD